MESFALLTVKKVTSATVKNQKTVSLVNDLSQSPN
jgi:hypothetical protein